MPEIPECPFNLKGDIVCAEFIVRQGAIAYSQTTEVDKLPGDFVVVGTGPGIPDKDGQIEQPKVSVGDVLVFQPQNAYLFQRDDLPNRKFAMIRAGMILATVNPDKVSKPVLFGLS